jgi:PAS domain S-box-containing protein
MDVIDKSTAGSYEEILKKTADTKKNKSFSKTYPAFIVLALFIGISFFVRQSFKEKVESETRASFDKAVNSVLTRVDNKYRSNLQVLTSIQGLYDTYVDVVRDYFKLYSSVPTSTNASIKSLMFVPSVKAGELDNHIFNMQRQGLWDYKIHPASKSEFYYPVEFIEPSEKNIENAGFDFRSAENVAACIDKARDNNIIVATPVIQTLSNKKTEGFYLIAPVYAQNSKREVLKDRIANYKGSVIQEIDADRFFKDALGGNFPSDTSIIFELSELDGAKESQIFTSKNISLLNKANFDGLSSKLIIEIADRKIEAKFYTIPNFSDWFTKNLPNISFAVSLAISFIFFGFVFSVTTSRARAVDLAERMTRSQRRIVESSKDIIAVLDMNGNWKSLNPAADTIFGRNSNEMLGEGISVSMLTPDDKNDFEKMTKISEGEKTIRKDMKMKSLSAEAERWISWSFTVSAADSLIYAVGRDVTLEKLAEAQAELRSKQIRLAEQFTREASEFKSYFMTKLSHQMRNSLTGIIGYLQLLDAKAYENEEEHDSYISLAEESSEELFVFVSDMVDVAIGDKHDANSISTIRLDKILKDSVKIALEEMPEDSKMSAGMMDEGEIPRVVADENLLTKAFAKIFQAVAEGSKDTEIQIAATENPHEGATEVQMMTNANPLVAEMIGIYKPNMNNIVEALDKDKRDVLLNFAIGASIIRMLNGTMTVETFGPEEGNIVQITLPLNKKIN